MMRRNRFDAMAQGSECGLCDLGAGHANGCERRQHELRDMNVVESDDG